MARREFSRTTRREALERARIDGQPRCEAVGASYGLPEGQRCYVPLARGVEFHHIREAEYGGDASLENCAAICRQCHRFVTGAFIKGLRKSDRIRDKRTGAFKKSGRGFWKPDGSQYDWQRRRYVTDRQG